MMLSEFERRAWDQRGTSEKHKPEMALKVCLDDIERGELNNVKHLAIVIVQDLEGNDRVGMYQAGTLSELAVEGALGRAIRMSVDNRRD
jgi:hypothetical protein